MMKNIRKGLGNIAGTVFQALCRILLNGVVYLPKSDGFLLFLQKRINKKDV